MIVMGAYNLTNTFSYIKLYCNNYLHFFQTNYYYLLKSELKYLIPILIKAIPFLISLLLLKAKTLLGFRGAIGE